METLRTVGDSLTGVAGTAVDFQKHGSSATWGTENRAPAADGLHAFPEIRQPVAMPLRIHLKAVAIILHQNL